MSVTTSVCPRPAASDVAVDYEHTGNLAGLLHQANLSLLVSTYQAGKLFTIGAVDQRLDLRFIHLDLAMGLARTPVGMAAASRDQVWTLRAAPELAPRVPPAGTHDICLLARQAHITGPIQCHDLAWAGNELWLVNTLFSCLCVLRPEYSFVPRWRPSFVTDLAAEDRCHLNGLAADGAGPRYVTALGETDTAAGWRPGKAAGGCLVEVPTGRLVARGLSMPHSPRLHAGQLWVLHSGYGQLNRVDLERGRLEVVAELPGYTRGLDLSGRLAFVGLSRIRETSVFGGLPIAERRADLRCGVAAVDLPTGRVLGTLLFRNGIEEIFDVKVLPGYRSPLVAGPHPDTDATEPLWLVPAANAAALSST